MWIMPLLEALAWLLMTVVAVPLLVLVIESFAALLPARREKSSTERGRCTILVPAHDEESGIEQTLTAILPQLLPTDQVVVIADNCTDRTAEVARSAGAMVVERQDTTRRGKGYALDFGVRYLELNPPEIV